MYDDLFTILIATSLACMEVAIYVLLATVSGVIFVPITFWLSLIVYSSMRNGYVLHKYAQWF